MAKCLKTTNLHHHRQIVMVNVRINVLLHSFFQCLRPGVGDSQLRPDPALERPESGFGSVEGFLQATEKKNQLSPPDEVSSSVLPHLPKSSWQLDH